jgi:hypothetical protein
MWPETVSSPMKHRENRFIIIIILINNLIIFILIFILIIFIIYTAGPSLLCHMISGTRFIHLRKIGNNLPCHELSREGLSNTLISSFYFRRICWVRIDSSLGGKLSLLLFFFLIRRVNCSETCDGSAEKFLTTWLSSAEHYVEKYWAIWKEHLGNAVQFFMKLI